MSKLHTTHLKMQLPEWATVFLASLEESPNVSAAARLAGITRRYAYLYRETHPEFREAWDEAVDAGVDTLEESAFKRAKEGSDVLAIFLLKAHRKRVYGDVGKTPMRGQLIVDLCSDGDPAPPPGDPAAT